MAEEAQVPTEEEMEALPRWARGAFASRCARRIQPLFQRGWTQAQATHIEAVNAAITLAEDSARQGRAHPLAGRVANWAQAAGQAAFAPFAVPLVGPESEVPFATRAAAASYAADTAAAAADIAVNTVNQGTGSSAFVAAKYATIAADTFGQKAVVASAIASDFATLKLHAHQSKWTDETPVDPDLLGPLWPDGEPKWA